MSSGDSGDSQLAESWISAFCSLVGHEYFAEVSEDFIEDDFNLTGLQSQVPMYKEALEMILDVEPEDVSDDMTEEEDEDEDVSDDASMLDREVRRSERRHLRMASDLSVIESSAEMLYGLIHQRFITSRPGIQQMMEKYEMGHFGSCPRVHCRGAKVLPVGCSDIVGHETVKLFCPSCLDVYAPPNSRFQTVDGAFFGTTFGCLFFMTFPEVDVGGTRPLENGNNSTLHANSSSSIAASSNASARSPSVPVQQTSSTPSSHSPSTPQQPTTINGVAVHNLAPGLGADTIYEPRIYGFRVSEYAKSGPRMKWLRSRPADMTELDEVAIWERAQIHLGNMRNDNANRAGGTDGATAVPEIEGDVEEDMQVQDEEEEDEELEEPEEEEEEGLDENGIGQDEQGVEQGNDGETLPADIDTKVGQEAQKLWQEQHEDAGLERRKKGRRKASLANGDTGGGRGGQGDAEVVE